MSPDELGRVFGREGLAQAVFTTELNHWSIPLRSGFGWHVVYISSRQPRREAPFAEVRDQVRLDFLDAERARRNTAAFAKVQASFKVVRE